MGTQGELKHRNRLIWAVIGGLSSIYWLSIGLQIQTFRILLGYPWHAMRCLITGLPDAWLLLPLAGLAGLVAGAVIRYPSRHFLNLVLIICLGYAFQLGFGFMEGRGIDGIRDRMVITGHAEFARIAALEDDVGLVAFHYEDFLKANPDLPYVQTKPPGQLLFYMGIQRASNLIAPVADPERRFDRLVTFASYTFPLLTYLALIPLFCFARLVAGDKVALWSALLYVFVPSVTLITLHLDQALYPCLTMLCLFITAIACKKQSPAYSLIAGAAVYLALFVSFSMIPIVLLVAATAVILSFNFNSAGGRIGKSAKVLAGLTVGFFISYVAGMFFLHYDPVVRYGNAMVFHQNWKLWEPGLGNTLLFGFLNFVEFACWIGIPLAAFLGTHVFGAVRRSAPGNRSVMDLLTMSLAAAIILTGFLGNTKGEVSRLWIFFVPFICLSVSHELSRLFENKFHYALASVLSLQFITIVAIKRFQDFW